MRKLEQRAIVIAKADRRSVNVKKIMGLGLSFSERLQILVSAGGERRTM